MPSCWQRLIKYCLLDSKHAGTMKFSKSGLSVALLASSTSAAFLELEHAKRERAQSPV
jgi:hypothetical protein